MPWQYLMFMAMAENPIHQEIQHVLPELRCKILVKNEAMMSQLGDVVNSSTSLLSRTMDG
jgi:hypothetical protein